MAAVGDDMDNNLPVTSAADGQRQDKEDKDWSETFAKAAAVGAVFLQGAGFALVVIGLGFAAVFVGSVVSAAIYQRAHEDVNNKVEDIEAAGVGPGFVDSFNVLCRFPAATIIQASCNQLSYSAQVDSAATGTAYFGDSALTTSAYGASRAAGEENSGDVRYEYCRSNVDAGVTIHVRSMCSSEP